MDRRHWLQSSACVAAGAAFGATGFAAEAGKGARSVKPLVVLVHGAFHWGGCFEKVANLLARRGFPVVTPDNRSHGYDGTAYNEVKTMGDYCAPVEKIIAEAQSPVVLLGHSLGGVTLGYLGERYPEKIRRLIYLSAIMCPNGESISSYNAANRAGGVRLPPIFEEPGPSDGVSLKLADDDLMRATFYNDCSERDIRIAKANLIATNPLPPFVWKMDITPHRYGAVPRAYIECGDDHALPLAMQRAFQADVPGAAVRRLATGHSPFFSQPEALAEVIADLA